MKEKYPHLMAFYYDTKKVKLTWRFDEQQADCIHGSWSLTEMKREIKSLLASQQAVEADAKQCAMSKLLKIEKPTQCIHSYGDSGFIW